MEVVADCPRDVGASRWPLVRATVPRLCSHFPARFVEVRSRDGNRSVGFAHPHSENSARVVLCYGCLRSSKTVLFQVPGLQLMKIVVIF